MDNWYLHFGIPKTLVTNQDHCFLSMFLTNCVKISSIDQNMTWPVPGISQKAAWWKEQSSTSGKYCRLYFWNCHVITTGQSIWRQLSSPSTVWSIRQSNFLFLRSPWVARQTFFQTQSNRPCLQPTTYVTTLLPARTLRLTYSSRIVLSKLIALIRLRGL